MAKIDLTRYGVTDRTPVRHIEKNGVPYLSRYYLGAREGGHQVWIHEFHTADGDEHLHNHAWTASSTVLRGFYAEAVLGPYGIRRRVRNRWDLPVPIGPETYHRITEVEPGTITSLIVAPGRLPNWNFLDPNGNIGEPRVDGDRLVLPEGWSLRPMPTEGEAWWKNYLPVCF